MEHLISKSRKDLNYITLLRFPLAVLVVLIHSYNTAWRLPGHEAMARWGTFCSQILPTFAVPLFFAISGYLFFSRMQEFSFTIYKEKLHRRVHTLLVPYVIWNVVAFLLYAAKDWVAHAPLQHPLSFNLLWGDTTMSAATSNFLGWTIHATTAPVQEPLWFVRDLIVLVLLSPIVWSVLKRFHWIGLTLFAAAYYLHIWPNLYGMSAMGLWFFSLGAFLAIEKKDPLSTTRRLLPLCSALLIPLLIAQTVLSNFNEWGCTLSSQQSGFLQLLHSHSQTLFSLSQQLYVLAAMVCAIHGADRLSKHWTPGAILSGSSFFIYASHVIVLFPLTAILSNASINHSAGWQITSYLLCPIIATGICLTIYTVLTKAIPRLSSPLLGR